MKKRRFVLVGKTATIVLKHGHTFLVKPGFILVKSRNNTYVVTVVNENSVRFYQGTAGGVLQTNISLKDFARRVNIDENFIVDVIIPKMRERIWEWCSLDAALDESMVFAGNCAKRYDINELCDETEYLILDSFTNGKPTYSWFVGSGMSGVYEHRTTPAVFNTDINYDCEGFVVLTKHRLEKLCEAEARLYAEIEESGYECELSIDINYGEVFKEEDTSEGFRYKHPESFEDEVLQNVPRWIKPVEKLPPNWWRETLDTDTEE